MSDSPLGVTPFAAPRPTTTQDAPLVAQVRLVVPLSEQERARLRAVLAATAGQPVELDVQLDPSILGGVWVRMGDLVIDGTIRARLDALNDQLCSQCNLLLWSGDVLAGNTGQ